MRDNPKHKGLRRQLIQELSKKGIKCKSVLAAMSRVPRHYFLDSSFEVHAYQNKAIPILANQTISHPYTVAFQTQTLKLKPEDKVLEIGTGSGYQTAVLLEMKANVYTIERQSELFKQAQLLLPRMGYRPKRFVLGDGYKGLADVAPFDKIIVTAGAPYVPKPLMAQLAIGGRLLIPVGDKVHRMSLFIRKSLKEFEKHDFGEFKFVPMIEDKN